MLLGDIGRLGVSLLMAAAVDGTIKLSPCSCLNFWARIYIALDLGLCVVVND